MLKEEIQPPSDGEVARSVMFYDWTGNINSTWLNKIEYLFFLFGETIREFTGHFQDKNSHGSYLHIRKRLTSVLDGIEPGMAFSSRFRSDITRPEVAFFPADLCLTLDRSGDDGITSASFSVLERHELYNNLIFEKAIMTVLGLVGAAYGGVWRFPARYGPDAYVAGVGTLSDGSASFRPQTYAGRMARWLYRLHSPGLRPRNGYLREVYPVNYLLEAHLMMPFRTTRFGNYIIDNGHSLEFIDHLNIYRWDVPTEDLERVRDDLEQSGYVLSSPSEPYRQT